jgi:serine/threonine protein kinase
MTTNGARVKGDIGVGLFPGDTIGGRYEIVRLLGAGGMGAVFEARHTAIGKTVAIKVLRPDAARDPQLAPRFLQEARSANDVRHKNIVEILDFGVEGNRPYMVLEYLHGDTLATVLERARWLPPGKIIRLLEPVMRALAFAHQRGIVHRDIKPDNIFLAHEEGEDGDTPKILDFGIAKRTLSADPKLTKTQTGLGTPSYMAPEQITAARDVTSAADQYAVGVILYEALCGRRPHEAESYEAMVVAKVTQPPKPIEARFPEIDPELAKVVMRVLSMAPGDRYESMVALRDALAPFRDRFEGPEPPDLPPPAPPRTEPETEELSAGAIETVGNAPTVAHGGARRAGSTTKTETPEVWTTRSDRVPKAVEPPARRSGATLAIVAVLIVGGVAVVGWRSGLLHGGSTSDSNHAARTTTTQATTTATPSSNPVVFRVRVQPATADILLDGVQVGQGAVEISRPRDGRPHRLVLQAQGFVTVDEELVGDADATVDRSLSPVPAAAPPPLPATAQTQVVAPPPANGNGGTRPSTHGRHGSTGGHESGPTGYPTIDRSNPF